ncbi:serine/threonine-protein kinase [Nocardiopsis ganjiahuensis]|uniref:serine/threonine-protein kinase n=1 Tax=Nocardiopsis ganjiahuensis TaxID=239984 RepID=UPI000348CB3D|nr:serine/threonine-protein kinase [Nocardiopsis ganjiahuensis]
MTSNGHESGKPLRAGDPRELDGYRIVSRLGRGGMGTVYLARDAADRSVAVKLIHPDLADDESFRLRFAREVASARRVARFSTAGVIDARLEGEPLFIVSEYVPGPNLDEAVRGGEPMHGGTLEGLAMGVAAALTAIHGSGIVHRDLKPANVLLSPVGPKVIDFGIARALDDAGGAVTRSSQLMGTPSYMAPELILGEQATAAADIFAWGCLVAFAGTGRAPFDAATVPAVLHNISSAAPKLEGLDPNLLDLVGGALDKKPENRPTSKQLLARLTGQEDPEESDIRRTITTSWAPPSSPPVPGRAPGDTDPELGEHASGGAPTPPGGRPSAPSGPAEAPAHPVFPRSTLQQAPPTQQMRPQSAQPVPRTQQMQAPWPGQANPQEPYPHPNSPQSGPQQGGHGAPSGGYPPVAQYQQHLHPQPGQPSYGQAEHGPQGQAPYGHSPSHGQPAHPAPDGPGGPGTPNGPGGPGQYPGAPRGKGSGGRRRLVLIGGAAVAVLLVAGVGATVVLSGADAPPEETTSIYVTDFANDDGWSSLRSFDPDRPEDTDGYWAQQSALMLQLDPAMSPSRGEVSPYDRETPDRVLISTDMAPLQGPAESSLGVRCWDQEGEEERTMYEGLVRFDGEQAQIRRVTEESGDAPLAETTDVKGFETFDLFAEDPGVEGLPYDVKVDDLLTNNLQFSCEYVAEDGDKPYMDLRMWVNGELVLSATDPQPLPDDSELDTEDRRRVGVVMRSGASTEPVASVFTNYALHRIDVDG